MYGCQSAKIGAIQGEAVVRFGNADVAEIKTPKVDIAGRGGCHSSRLGGEVKANVLLGDR